MPYQKLKSEHPEYDPNYVQQKIELIVKGLPIDISEEELQALESMLRGARSFYIDLLIVLEGKEDEESKKHYLEEALNLAGTELALRRIDIFRKEHWSKIKPII
jgi:hypothetical protein